MVNTFNLLGFYFHPHSILSSHLFSNVCIHNNPQASISLDMKGPLHVWEEENFCYVDMPCSTPFSVWFWNGHRFRLPIWGNNVIDTCNVMDVDIVNFYNNMKFFSSHKMVIFFVWKVSDFEVRIFIDIFFLVLVEFFSNVEF